MSQNNETKTLREKLEKITKTLPKKEDFSAINKVVQSTSYSDLDVPIAIFNTWGNLANISANEIDNRLIEVIMALRRKNGEAIYTQPNIQSTINDLRNKQKVAEDDEITAISSGRPGIGNFGDRNSGNTSSLNNEES